MERDQIKDKSIATKPTNASSSSSSPAVAPTYHFKIGEKVEARLNSDGLGDAWYKAEITGHDTLLNGQLAVYIIKHKASMQDGDSNSPKIASVQERNIRRVPAFSPQVKRPAHFNILSASASKKPKQESQSASEHEEASLSNSTISHQNPNPSPNLNPNGLVKCTESSNSSLAHDKIKLPFKKVSPLWDHVLQACDIFKKVPQEPHFKNIHRKYSNNEGERDAIALGLFVSYANLATSIETLTIDADVAVFDRLLSWANSLEKNGFNVNPIRAYLKELLKKKSEVIEERLKLSELERKFLERQKDVEVVKSEVLKQEKFVRDCECVLPKLPWKK